MVQFVLTPRDDRMMKWYGLRRKLRDIQKARDKALDEIEDLLQYQRSGEDEPDEAPARESGPPICGPYKRPSEAALVQDDWPALNGRDGPETHCESTLPFDECPTGDMADCPEECCTRQVYPGAGGTLLDLAVSLVETSAVVQHFATTLENRMLGALEKRLMPSEPEPLEPQGWAILHKLQIAQKRLRASCDMLEYLGDTLGENPQIAAQQREKEPE